jgi:uncharacterized membrane protein
MTRAGSSPLLLRPRHGACRHWASALTVAEGEAEKCYGISKAGANARQIVSSSCVGTSKRDSQRDAWLYVRKRTCGRLLNGGMKLQAWIQGLGPRGGGGVSEGTSGPGFHIAVTSYG